MDHQTFACRRGLAVLLHEGAAAWIEAWGRCVAPSVSLPSPPRAERALSNDQHAEVVQLLANMALDNLEKEIRT